jgi:hypothetical protein
MEDPVRLLPPAETIMPPMVVELVRQLVEEDGYTWRAPIHSSTKAVQPMKIFLPTKVEMQSIFLSLKELVVLSFGWMPLTSLLQVQAGRIIAEMATTQPKTVPHP